MRRTGDVGMQRGSPASPERRGGDKGAGNSYIIALILLPKTKLVFEGLKVFAFIACTFRGKVII